MPITIHLSYTADLAQPLRKTLLHQAFLTGDQQAHCFRVALQAQGSALSLTDTSVAGYFIRPDGATVSILGSMEDGCAVVTLPAACYHQPGRFSLILRLTQGDVKTTVFWAEGTMALSSTDTLVDDGVIPSLDDLLSQISAMESATEAATEIAQTLQQKLDSGELTGKGLTILGYYESAAALSAAVTSPQPGDAYAVGTAAPYDTYIWNGTDLTWVNNGTLQGVEGKQGVQGVPGQDGASAARSLLDNGCFSATVNQRASTAYSGSVYTIDRWQLSDSGASLTVNPDSITLTGGSLIQRLESYDSSETYTLAACDTSGNLRLLTGKFANAPSSTYLGMDLSGSIPRVLLKAGTWQWIALYKGSYTEDTLPDFLPKGYTEELLACQRYYYRVPSSSGTAYPGYSSSATQARITIQTPVTMRITPTVTVENVSQIRIFDPSSAKTPTAVSILENDGNGVVLAITTSGLTAWTTCTARFNTAVGLSADL